jgi:cytochrome c oxidase subunit 2
MGSEENAEQAHEETTAVRGGSIRVLPLLAIVTLSSAIGIALGLAIDWFPTQASEQAKSIDTLWDVLIIVSVPIFVLVETVVLYSVYKWRMRVGEEELDGPPIHGNTRLEIIWTAIPAVLLVSLVGYAYVVLTDIEDARADSMQVRVVGEQFAWTYFYPPAEPGGKEVEAKQLYLPNGKQVQFDIQSKDVIHDFWVPAFRMKVDAVRGITTNYRINTTRTGDYPVVCAELCGLGHSVMRSTVHVLEPAAFDEWLSKQRAQAKEGK